VLAFIAALLCLLAFFTPFFDTGAFNAATGALGLWTWYALSSCGCSWPA
jgi:hypothetical protein